MINDLIEFIRDEYKTNKFIPLHAPCISNDDKKYVLDTIDSTFVSSVGKYVDLFEDKLSHYTKSVGSVAVSNGTSALHTSLILSGVSSNDLVITQPLTFVATCNAIYYCNADPIFIDIDINRLTLCPKSLEHWLQSNADINNLGECIHVKTRRKIKACVPMHTFGHPAEIDLIVAICKKWNIAVIEDAAESLGSFFKGKHTGTYGEFGAISFNGNKIITTGGGGMILCSSIKKKELAKHVTTTAKIAHDFEFIHDMKGYNYRMPNLNAALGCSQLEKLDMFLNSKRELALKYKEFFKNSEYTFFEEPADSKSNYWLNTIICRNKNERDFLIKNTNKEGINTRPSWELMSNLKIYSKSIKGDIENAEELSTRIVNLPSSVNNILN